MSQKVFQRLFFGCVIILLSGCAGPTSPFGAIDFFNGDGGKLELSQSDTKGIEFNPGRQVLHGKADLKVRIVAENPIEKDHELSVSYNGRNVSKVFGKHLTQYSEADKVVDVTFPSVRLRPDKKHEIALRFLTSKSNPAETLQAHFMPPECPTVEMQTVVTTEDFKPQEEILQHLHRMSNLYGFNPAMLTGIIAQESGFNKKAISKARAVGLTQMTKLADDQIKTKIPTWPRDLRFTALPLWHLEKKVEDGEITEKNDWRLDPYKSIEGGLLYLSYLRDYWRKPTNSELIEKYAGGDATAVLLASYNSGAARVKAQLEQHNKRWMFSSELNEAFKYVNKVTSFCYHFSRR